MNVRSIMCENILIDDWNIVQTILFCTLKKITSSERRFLENGQKFARNPPGGRVTSILMLVDH